MLYLLFAILSSSGIFLCFKYLEKFKIDLIFAIIINYITASLCGYILSEHKLNFHETINQTWFGLSIIIGILFIGVFFLIGRSTQKAGISITTLASKMSFVLPMIFSIIYYQETISIQKTIGIGLAISSVLLSIYNDESNKRNRKYLWLPVLLFLGAGLVDSMVKFAQEEHLSDGGSEQFSTLLFAIAAITGIVVLVIRKQNLLQLLHPNILLGGVILGLSNFGSLYFLIASLNKSGFDSSIVFGIINIGIVMLSVLFGLSIFHEKLNKLNLLGFLMAFIAIFILTN